MLYVVTYMDLEFTDRIFLLPCRQYPTMTVSATCGQESLLFRSELSEI